MCTAALDDEYEKVSMPGGVRPFTDPVLMMRLGSSALAPTRSNGSSFCVRKNTPRTLTFITLSQPPGENDSIGSPQEAPALLQRMSSRSQR